MLTRLCLPSLIERKGLIINIGSAITCLANSALGAYGATKAGLAYWNDGLRRELQPQGVRVCLVEPGPIQTEFMDAVQSRVLPGERTDPINDNLMPWMTAEVDEVAPRVARLLDHPRRRVSILRRLVWPFRALGVIARVCPPLGDWLVVTFSRRPLSPSSTGEEPA
jgi:short-subunit dehydrogenase